MRKFDRIFATAILSGALALGSGVTIAAAHHGDPTGHSTTKGKTLSDIEIKERQITAELNRKQLMPQVAALETPAASAVEALPMSDEPMQSEVPAMPSDAQAAVADMDQADLAAIQGDEMDVAN
jgi:hypothetical protein